MKRAASRAPKHAKHAAVHKAKKAKGTHGAVAHKHPTPKPHHGTSTHAAGGHAKKHK